MKDKIFEQLNKIDGKTGFYYKNLVTGKEIASGEEILMMAASVIKIPIMVAFFSEINKGKFNEMEKYILKEEDKRPSCGCLNCMQAGLEITYLDICYLMIILSDNSATNILIQKIGLDVINQTMKDLGYKNLILNRLLFDLEASRKGIQNYVSCIEIADILEKLYYGTLINKKYSEKMIAILSEQRLNGKIPFYFKEKITIAHKTGEDDGITHDVGIIYGKEPFILCCMGNEVETPVFEKFMQKIAWDLNQGE